MSHEEFPQLEEELRLDGDPALRNRLIACINEKGFMDPEAQALLIEWTKQNEAWAMAKNERDSNVLVSIAQAFLYLELGFYGEGMEELAKSREDAFHQGNDEVVAKIEALMDKVDQFLTAQEQSPKPE